MLNIELLSNLLIIIEKSIIKLQKKLRSLPPYDYCGYDVYWYHVLKRMERNIFEYIAIYHIFTNRELYLVEDIKWFMISWPPKKYKSGFFKPPSTFPPVAVF